MNPMSMKAPASFMSSFGWKSSRNPRKPVRKISGIKIKTTPIPITTLSISSAKKRSQKSAYSTQGTAADLASVGISARPPPKGAAAAALIIGVRGAAAATENACPQFAQSAAPSVITLPHLEQYKVSPRIVLWSSYELTKLQPNPTFKQCYGQPCTGQDRGW